MEMNHGDPSRRVTRNVRTHTEADQSEVGAVCVCGATLRLAQPFTMRYTDCTQSVVSTHRCGTVVACAKPATSSKCLLSTVPTEEMGSNNLRAARPPAPCCELWVPDPARRATKFPCGGYEGAPPGRHRVKFIVVVVDEVQKKGRTTTVELVRMDTTNAQDSGLLFDRVLKESVVAGMLHTQLYLEIACVCRDYTYCPC